MSKEYNITAIKKIYAGNIKKQRDYVGCETIEEALSHVDFNEKDLEFVRVSGFRIPRDGGCEDLFEQNYFLGEIVSKEEVTDKEINQAMLRHEGFVRENEIANYIKTASGSVYICFEGDKILDTLKEHNHEV